MKIVILGLGYIGLPTATLLANQGFSVLGVDIDPEKVKKVNRGEVHFSEPGLETALKSAVNRGKLVAETEVSAADVFIICVPTPVKVTRDLKTVPDLFDVETASQSILPHLQPGNLVILESTVPAGTTRNLVAPILEKSGLKAGEDFLLAFCPERVLPGKILDELQNNDRIIGGFNEISGLKAREIYQSFCRGGILLTSCEVAETVKLAENSYRDVNIAFANELANICEELGIPVWQVIELANRHPRVNILKPGPGVGGHCIPIDPWFLIDSAPEKAKLLRAAREVNDARPSQIVEKIKSLLTAQGKEPGIIACLGGTFKAEVDDTRESPALKIVKLLLKDGHRVRLFDPYIKALPFSEPDFSLSSSPQEAVKAADLLLLLVDHQEFKGLSLEELRSLMEGKTVIDTRGVW